MVNRPDWTADHRGSSAEVNVHAVILMIANGEDHLGSTVLLG
jgi:hypothetical protein